MLWLLLGSLGEHYHWCPANVFEGCQFHSSEEFLRRKKKVQSLFPVVKLLKRACTNQLNYHIHTFTAVLEFCFYQANLTLSLFLQTHKFSYKLPSENCPTQQNSTLNCWSMDQGDFITLLDQTASSFSREGLHETLQRKRCRICIL